MKVFLDTNIWLRFLTADNETLYQKCLSLFENIERGRIKPYTSTIVLLEIHFVLAKIYQISKENILKDLSVILKTRNLTLIEKTNFPKALHYYQKYQVKLADCLIASQLPKTTTLCTFDQEFKKIKEIKIATPQDL